jgi:ABC-type dipeptide/oligopeptide/nickel transport system permease component
MHLSLTHLQAALLFAFFTSIVMGVIGRSTDKERIRYGVSVFGYFIVAIFGLGWLMYFGHG